jgi:hypothetical protein
MSNFVSLKSAVLYVTEETTEGVAVDPTLGGQAVAVNSDGLEMTGEKELIERNIIRGGIGRVLPRTGMKSMTGSIAVEARASATAGAEPEAALLFESAFGGVRSLSSTITIGAAQEDSVTIGTNAASFAAGDIVMIKDTNSGSTGYHITPITAVNLNGTNADSLTLLVPAENAPSNGSVIEKFTTFFGTDDGHPSLTVTEFLEDAYKRQGVGVKVNSLTLDGFEPGQTANFSFGLQGWDLTEDVAVSGVAETYSDALPPLVLDACVYKDGVKLEVSSFSFSLENTIGVVPSTCSLTGKIGQRTSERAVSGSFTVFADKTSSGIFDAFSAGTQFSVFASMYNPGSSAGVKKEAIGVYMPKCIITAAPMADADGLMVYNVEFQAGMPDSGSDIYLGFI